MPLEVDHAFVACAAGAPEGDALLRAGFVEGSANTHPGQGTANRRFYFENFMLELMWVADPAEAQSAQTRRTRLWERWSQRLSGISPFGIVFRAAGDHDLAAPFPTWAYHPSYLPPGLAIHIAAGTALHEPELFYLPFLRNSGAATREPTDHAPPIRRVRGLCVGVPSLQELSAASRVVEQQGLLRYFQSAQPRLEILFVADSDRIVDLRPALPLLFRGVA
ncbi:MAG: VOC family protein [Steroidobacteraceae bacterium]